MRVIFECSDSFKLFIPISFCLAEKISLTNDQLVEYDKCSDFSLVKADFKLWIPLPFGQAEIISLTGDHPVEFGEVQIHPW